MTLAKYEAAANAAIIAAGMASPDVKFKFTGGHSQGEYVTTHVTMTFAFDCPCGSRLTDFLEFPAKDWRRKFNTVEERIKTGLVGHLRDEGLMV